MFACAPLCGWTLACSAPNSCFRAIDCRLLNDVGPFAAAVVTLSGIAFGVLVGENRARSFEHCFADEVFAQRSTPGRWPDALTSLIDGRRNHWVDFSERCGSQIGHLVILEL